jgi:hypothetical protein
LPWNPQGYMKKALTKMGIPVKMDTQSGGSWPPPERSDAG